MKNLNVTVISERELVASMAGCGKNWNNLCGSRDCTGGKRA